MKKKKKKNIWRRIKIMDLFVLHFSPLLATLAVTRETRLTPKQNR
jgi:hypothetical protein